MKKNPWSVALVALTLVCLVGSAAAAEPEHQATLYADFTQGAPDGTVEQYELGYSGELTAAALAKGLSDLTGLDFLVSLSPAADGLGVDWAADSTLIANLDDRAQNENFRFFDADSMRWFMMDSLWRTLTENLGAQNIYYTMDGGKELIFEELQPVSAFPEGVPYMGSAFYFAHEGGRGDIEGASDMLEGWGDIIDENGDVIEGFPFIVDEAIVGDPPEGEISVFVAREELSRYLLASGQVEDLMRVTGTYTGIVEIDGVECYGIDLTGEGGPRSFAVSGKGFIFRKTDAGVYEPVTNDANG
jgi:hypothetical protein